MVQDLVDEALVANRLLDYPEGTWPAHAFVYDTLGLRDQLPPWQTGRALPDAGAGSLLLEWRPYVDCRRWRSYGTAEEFQDDFEANVLPDLEFDGVLDLTGLERAGGDLVCRDHDDAGLRPEEKILFDAVQIGLLGPYVDVLSDPATCHRLLVTSPDAPSAGEENRWHLGGLMSWRPGYRNTKQSLDEVVAIIDAAGFSSFRTDSELNAAFYAVRNEVVAPDLSRAPAAALTRWRILLLALIRSEEPADQLPALAALNTVLARLSAFLAFAARLHDLCAARMRVAPLGR